MANGLYDGVPRSGTKAAIRPLTSKELRTVAKPDNAGKVSTDVVQILRDVVRCRLPTNVQPVSPLRRCRRACPIQGQDRSWRGRRPRRCGSRSPRSQARRHELCSGPPSDGVAPACRRCRADHQSVEASSASAATASSMRGPRCRESSRPGDERVAEGDPRCGRCVGRLAPLRQDAVGALRCARARPARRSGSTGRRRRRGTAGPSRPGSGRPRGR